MEAVAACVRQAPGQALADAGYRTEKNGEDLARSSTLVVVPLRRKGKRRAEIGLRQFSRRALHRVQAEFKLVCLAPNLRRACTLKAAQ